MGSESSVFYVTNYCRYDIACRSVIPIRAVIEALDTFTDRAKSDAKEFRDLFVKIAPTSLPGDAMVVFCYLKGLSGAIVPDAGTRAGSSLTV